jgi:Helix-turn-helix domain
MSMTPMITKGARITGSTRSALATDLKYAYEVHKVSIRDLVEGTGRSYGFVHRLLVESGVTLRGRGRHRPGWRPK